MSALPAGVRRGLCPAVGVHSDLGYAPGAGLALFDLNTRNVSSARKSLMQTCDLSFKEVVLNAGSHHPSGLECSPPVVHFL